MKLSVDYNELKTLRELSEQLDASVVFMWIFDRFKGLIDRLYVKDAVKHYGSEKVYNYFHEDSSEIIEVYLNLFR